MSKAYWVVTYQEIHDPAALAAYAALAGPAVAKGGGRFLVRGMPEAVYEQGLMNRVVLTEFESLEAALALYDSPAYQQALVHLAGGAVRRDMRIVEGV